MRPGEQVEVSREPLPGGWVGRVEDLTELGEGRGGTVLGGEREDRKASGLFLWLWACHSLDLKAGAAPGDPAALSFLTGLSES